MVEMMWYIVGNIQIHSSLEVYNEYNAWYIMKSYSVFYTFSYRFDCLIKIVFTMHFFTLFVLFNSAIAQQID